VDSNQFRYVTRRAGFEIIKQHPLLGVGPEYLNRPGRLDEFVPADIPRPLPVGYYRHLHNLYVHYAAERGLPTTLMLVWMLIWILWDFFRGLRKLPPGRSNERFILQGGIACVLGIMVSGLFEVNLGDSEVLAVFLTVVALGYVAVPKPDTAIPQLGTKAAI
jgi:O-antigen ligase